jgi:hypothetical protein
MRLIEYLEGSSQDAVVAKDVRKEKCTLIQHTLQVQHLSFRLIFAAVTKQNLCSVISFRTCILNNISGLPNIHEVYRSICCSLLGLGFL